MGNITELTNEALRLLMSYGPKLILAIFTLVIGLYVIKALNIGLKKVLTKQKLDLSLISFLHALVASLLKVLLVLSVLSMVGVEVTSFIAFLGAAGLAVGLALQGSLQNFAGGVMIMLFKPYKVGDLISAQGYTGEVSEIQIFHTVLKTVENHTIVVPNSPLSTGSLINYSTEPHRRVDIVVPIANNADINKIRTVLTDLTETHPLILKNPAAGAVITEIGVGVVKLVLNAWVHPKDYWEVFFFLNENVKTEFEKHGIPFPTPTQNINLRQQA